MTVTFHQPNYLPNLGFFYKMAHVDLFIVGTNIQFEKGEGWQQRHKIPGPASDLWLTVPVLGSQNQMIKDVKINNAVNWRRKHKKTLELTYKKTPEQELLSKIANVYDSQWVRLAELNLQLINLFKEALGISTPVVFDEELSGEKYELLLNICEKYKADTYLSGMGAKDYMTQEYYSAMKDRGITHQFVDKNLTALYPYSSVHYILRDGRKAVSQLLQ